MNKIKLCTVVFSLVLLCLTFQSVAWGDAWNNKTIVTLDAPVEVPGHDRPIAIGPGTFVFKLMENLADRNIVQIWNADETQLLATILAVPDYRMHPVGKTIIQFGETATGSPPAIREWFYPGRRYGFEFVYPRSRAVELAKANNQNVLSTTNNSSSEPRTLVKNSVTAVTPGGEDAAVTTAATSKQ